jgi:hypothetical protein
LEPVEPVVQVLILLLVRLETTAYFLASPVMAVAEAYKVAMVGMVVQAAAVAMVHRRLGVLLHQVKETQVEVAALAVVIMAQAVEAVLVQLAQTVLQQQVVMAVQV